MIETKAIWSGVTAGIIGLAAAIASFFLIAGAGLLILMAIASAKHADDSLGLALFFSLPIIVPILIGISLVIGVIVYLFANNKLSAAAQAPHFGIMLSALMLSALLAFFSMRSLGFWRSAADIAADPGPLHVVKLLSRSGGVTGVAWSPDGSKLATFSSAASTITIWDAADWHVIREFHRASNGVGSTDLVWLPSGQVLTAAATSPQLEHRFSLSLWDPESGTQTKEIPGPNDGANFQFNTAGHFGVSGDGATVAVSLTQARNSVFILDARTWSYRATLPLQRDIAAAFSFAANHLAVGAFGGNLDIFDLGQNSLERTITAFPASIVGGVAYSPDGQLLAAVPLLQSPVIADPLRIWRPQTGEAATTFSSSSKSFKALAWNPDGNSLAAAGDNRTLTVWNIKSGTPQTFHPLAGDVAAVRFSSNGTLAAAGGDDIVVLK